MLLLRSADDGNHHSLARLSNAESGAPRVMMMVVRVKSGKCSCSMRAIQRPQALWQARTRKHIAVGAFSGDWVGEMAPKHHRRKGAPAGLMKSYGQSLQSRGTLQSLPNCCGMTA